VSRKILKWVEKNKFRLSRKLGWKTFKWVEFQNLKSLRGLTESPACSGGGGGTVQKVLWPLTGKRGWREVFTAYTSFAIKTVSWRSSYLNTQRKHGRTLLTVCVISSLGYVVQKVHGHSGPVVAIGPILAFLGTPPMHPLTSSPASLAVFATIVPGKLRPFRWSGYVGWSVYLFSSDRG